MKKSFMREKVIHCGKDYLSPEIFPYTGTQQQAVKGKRGKKKKVSEPKQKNLNDKRAKRYFIQLANANFGEGDLAVHLTYAPEFLPDSYEEAIKIVINFLRRVAYLRKKRGLPPLKYLLITQMGRNGKRIHHHILMNGGLDRDEVESLWWKVKESKKKKRPAVMYGWATMIEAALTEAKKQWGTNENVKNYIESDPLNGVEFVAVQTADKDGPEKYISG